MRKSIIAIRNAKIVGNNSKSYDDKHPNNPVSLRPIHEAVMNTPKLFVGGRFVPNVKRINFLYSLGNMPRMDIPRIINRA